MDRRRYVRLTSGSLTMRIIIVAAALAVMLAGPAGAQLWGDWIADNLRTGCAPMALAVKIAGAAKGDDALRERLENAAESRLRAAGIFAEPQPPPRQWLSLSVLASMPGAAGKPDVAKHGVSLSRIARDSGYGRSGPVIVWHRTGISGYRDVRDALADLIDQFLNAYLRANPECAR